MDAAAQPHSEFVHSRSDDSANQASGTAKSMIWLLLGGRRGDNNQMLALAEGLGLPFQTKVLSYNMLRHFRWLGLRRAHLSPRARALLTPPWPDLVIGVGCNSLPVARYIRRRSGGLARLVQIGNPRSSIDDLDLVITTPQFVPREGPNVLSLPFPIGNPALAVTITDEEDHWFAALPHPRRLVAVGGSTRKWKIDNKVLGRAIAHLQNLGARDGGSVIAVTSPRTSRRTRRLLEERLTGPTDALVDDFPRFATLLDRCDEFYVTADSVSMLAEAIFTGKPVGMIPIARTLKGRIAYWTHRLGFPYHADLSKFWTYLASNNLVGSVASPIASGASDTVPIAVSAVRRILETPAHRAIGR